MLKFTIYYFAFYCFLSDALYISDWKLNDGDERIKRDEAPKFKLQLKNFNKDGDGTNQLVERIKDKIEKLKEGREESPIVGQINPSIMDYSPHSTGILPRPPIVAPGYHRPLLPALNPLPHTHYAPYNPYHHYNNPFNPYHYHDPILVAPAYRSALPLPPHTPVLHALKNRVGDLLDKAGKHGPGLLDSDATSNSESQINQINVNVRSDPTTPHTFLSHFFPWLDPFGNSALPFVGAPNPENAETSNDSVTEVPNLVDLGEVTTQPTTELKKEESVTTAPVNKQTITPENPEKITIPENPEQQKPVEVETKTPILLENTEKPELINPENQETQQHINLQQAPIVNENNDENVAPKVLEDDKQKPVEVKKLSLQEKKKFALLIKNKKLAEKLLKQKTEKQKIDEEEQKTEEKPSILPEPIVVFPPIESLPMYKNQTE
ncbi:PREDICTED: uncharacterized protein LOC108562801 [Nicrophorus vespilloides]|uniref:Uncharacterized protein LOC108562801 n=1 Tax=Nicrophorus vespilloides TaxID=110193 RepID=A0ABM1MQ75_NICVS|nr:PREDICTED: uncharacterized protein LOC108562801 [Nicrophorus vespilloides]